MRLADYLDSHAEQILGEWRTCAVNALAPGDHARDVLAAIAVAPAPA